jgi:hypothetical protein
MKFMKDPGKLCQGCGERPALFRHNGRVKKDTKHTLCFRCDQALIDALRARRFVRLKGKRSA